MRTRFIPLLLLALSVIFYLACSNQSTAPSSEASAGNTASPAAAALSATTATELEPVMPEKVQVAFEQNCKSCHGPDGHGITSIAPDLRKSARRTLSEWVAYLKDQKGPHSNAKIPAMASLTDEDIEAIGGYLADLTQNNLPATKK